jgi:hypothetical protein
MRTLGTRYAQTVVHFAVEGGMKGIDVQPISFEGQPNPGSACTRTGVSLSGHGYAAPGALRSAAAFSTVAISSLRRQRVSPPTESAAENGHRVCHAKASRGKSQGARRRCGR